MHGVIERRRNKEARSAIADADAALTLKISSRLNRALTKVATKSGKPKQYHVRRALEKYLEDTWDVLQADEALKSMRKTYSMDEVKKRLGLED
jgi:predicted DNA-binding protein